MLVAQDPALDPRIDWSASSAGGQYDVTVLGIGAEGEAPGKPPASYIMRRCSVAVSPRSAVAFAALLCAELSALQRIVFGLIAPVLGAALVVLVSAHRLSRRYPALRAAAAATSGRMVPSAWRARRLRAFLLSLYRHFAPVTAAFLSVVEQSGPPPAIVHCNDLDTLLVGVELKRKYGCAVVYDAHEYWPFSDPCFTALEQRFYAFYERLLVHRADQVITVNPLLARRLESDYRLQDVISIPNAVPLRPRIGMQHIDETLASVAGPRVKFLYLGGFAVHRGIEELLEAWRHVDPRRAVLFLRGPDNALRSKYQDLAKNLGMLHRSVYFLPAVEADELIDSARSADVGIIPYRPTILNHVYSCPNKLSQYLQAGLMLLADSNLLYVAQVVKQSRAGILYDSSATSSLLSAINTIFDDPGLLSQCKTNAVRYAESHFNWDRFSGSLRGIYDRLGRA